MITARPLPDQSLRCAGPARPPPLPRCRPQTGADRRPMPKRRAAEFRSQNIRGEKLRAETPSLSPGTVPVPTASFQKSISSPLTQTKIVAEYLPPAEQMVLLDRQQSGPGTRREPIWPQDEKRILNPAWVPCPAEGTASGFRLLIFSFPRYRLRAGGWRWVRVFHHPVARHPP